MASLCVSVLLSVWLTFEGTSEQTGAHADVSMPLGRMEPDEPSDKRGRQEMMSLFVSVDVGAEFLRTTVLLITISSCIN